MKNKIIQRYAKYVSLNIMGMVGISLYILADTYFISKVVGAKGITALNLVLPLYSLIYAFGHMIGVGSAIRYSIEKGKNSKKSNFYFTNAFIWGTMIGIFFMIVGGFFSKEIVALLGGDEEIVRIGASYTRIFMLFAPAFIWNCICNAFVRNDGSPTIAMLATLFSSLFNIVFDYILMFVFGLGMSGAALATACSPLVGVSICCIHFFSKKNTVHFSKVKPSIKKLIFSCQVGISSFVSEISSGVITLTFNLLILKLVGNIGVAAYGVVANTALVAVSVFNGVSQGSQPLLSEAYGKGEIQVINLIKKLIFITALILAGIIFVGVFFGAEWITSVFNSENNRLLSEYAIWGLRLYFIGFFFAGINIVSTSFFSAIDQPKIAFVASIMRGFLAIIFFAIIMGNLFGITGIWLAYPVAEVFTLVFIIVGFKKVKIIQ